SQFVNRLSAIQRPTLPTPDGVSLSLTAVTSDRRKKRRLGRVRFSHEPSHSGQISYEAQPELIAAHPLRVMRAILATKAFRVLNLAHQNLDRQFRTNR
ncbi:hypothetical protein ACCS42_36170, partial [Rhizobium ruizarguesonis]